MKIFFWPVIQSDDISTRGNCLYCNALLGNDHAANCHVVKQTVVFELTHSDGTWLEVISYVPNDWSLEFTNERIKSGEVCSLIKHAEKHGISENGDSYQAVRFASVDDHANLLNISESRNSQHQ